MPSNSGSLNYRSHFPWTVPPAIYLRRAGLTASSQTFVGTVKRKENEHTNNCNIKSHLPATKSQNEEILDRRSLGKYFSRKMKGPLFLERFL